MALLTSDEGPMGNVAVDAATVPHAIESISVAHSETGLPTILNEEHEEDRQSSEPEQPEPLPAKIRADKLDITYKAMDVTQNAPKKARLVSVDSGFGSFGPSELNVVAISSEASTAVAYVARSSSAFDAMPVKELADKPTSNCGNADADVHCEKDDKLSPLMEQPRRLSDGAAMVDKAREYRKNRTTTLVTNDDPNAELDVRLINRYDGLKDVMCYLDEDGAPQVRDKQTKRKSTLKQELKNRNLGASLDGERMQGLQKKSNWVSFSRLCKKFKESFLSKCHVQKHSRLPNTKQKKYTYYSNYNHSGKCSFLLLN